MVQVIQRRPQQPKKKTFGESFSEGLLSTLKEGAQLYQKHQEKKQLAEGLQNLEGIYANPELNDQQKLIETYRQLAANPQLAGQLGSQLSHLGSAKNRADEFAAKLKQEEQDKKAMMTFGEKLRKSNPNDPMINRIADIYTSDLSPDFASTMVRDLTGSLDPFKVQQQQRLQSEHI